MIQAPLGFLLLAILMSAGQALAQGNDAASASAAPTEGSGPVPVGAGNLSDASTTGSSGPQDDTEEDEPPAPLEPGFSLVPPGDAFWGPAQLPWQQPSALRCEIIEDANARRHCEGEGRQLAQSRAEG